MTDSRHTAYAQAIIAIAAAEGASSAVESELPRVAEAVRGSEELRDALGNPATPIAQRLQLVDNLLGDKAHATTLSVVSMLVGNGRGAELPAIVDEVLAVAAGSRGEVIAEVRSAVALSSEQISRLAEALKQQTNSDVSIRNIVDPSVVGGIVTQIGDTLLDGSVRTRLNQLREAF
ncbi:MAG TPA: ATP synthase F1 subunit delta [Acidimicrobiaceae bacterium]|jgi:F-type H+-transporting ATPase subunit delta|nr:ATP synthase F1 subunit delta [Acidimicrobiaceae bacterium]